MGIPTTRQELIDYCLRELGAPVIEINVDDDQLEDRMDDILQLFHTYHFDGVHREFLRHTITAQNITDQYIDLDPSIIAVVRIFPHSTSQGTNNIFSVRYQIALNDFYDISSVDLSAYDIAKRQINMYEELLVGEQSLRFNRHMNRVFLDADWDERYSPGDILLFEVYREIDPATYGDIWNDEFIKKYLVSLIKKQWGNNLKKFNGVQLPGGIELNGKEIYDEAIEEIDKWNEELDLKYSVPPGFFVR